LVCSSKVVAASRCVRYDVGNQVERPPLTRWVGYYVVVK
jgi:hypothetical protein